MCGGGSTGAHTPPKSAVQIVMPAPIVRGYYVRAVFGRFRPSIPPKPTAESIPVLSGMGMVAFKASLRTRFGCQTYCCFHVI